MVQRALVSTSNGSSDTCFSIQRFNRHLSQQAMVQRALVSTSNGSSDTCLSIQRFNWHLFQHPTVQLTLVSASNSSTGTCLNKQCFKWHLSDKCSPRWWLAWLAILNIVISVARELFRGTGRLATVTPAPRCQHNLFDNYLLQRYYFRYQKNNAKVG